MRSLAEHWQQEGKELGILEGLQVGEAKGIQIGKAEERVEIAKKLLSQGCNIALISSVTGLDEAFISSLE